MRYCLQLHLYLLYTCMTGDLLDLNCSLEEPIKIKIFLVILIIWKPMLNFKSGYFLIMYNFKAYYSNESLLFINISYWESIHYLTVSYYTFHSSLAKTKSLKNHYHHISFHVQHYLLLTNTSIENFVHICCNPYTPK